MKAEGSSVSKYTDYLDFPQSLQENGRDIIPSFWLVKMHSGLFLPPKIRNNMTEAQDL
jgi:hypothetical protein